MGGYNERDELCFIFVISFMSLGAKQEQIESEAGDEVNERERHSGLTTQSQKPQARWLYYYHIDEDQLIELEELLYEYEELGVIKNLCPPRTLFIPRYCHRRFHHLAITE